MNLIRFRERLASLSGKQLKPEAVMEFQSSPVFMVGSLAPMSDMELEWCRQHVLDASGRVPSNLPFRVFSVIYTIDGHAYEGVTNTALLVWGKEYSHAYKSEDKRTDERIDSKITTHMMLEIGKDQGFVVSRFTGKERHGIVSSCYLNGKDTTSKIIDDPARKAALQEISAGSRNVLLKVLFDLMNPANVVLRVMPNQTGRSVQWVQARTHYTIINKSQAQRCLIEKRGPTDHEIDRAAHWRRAHMRRLMSDKFTHKKGQLVFVKQSWVGPEEWEGTDRKVYKVTHIKPPP